MRAAVFFLILSLSSGGSAAWAAPKDDLASRLAVIEYQTRHLEKQDELLRAEAAKAAKDEAGGVSTQVQGVKDLLLMLASGVAVIGGGGGLVTYYRAMHEARQQAKEGMAAIHGEITAAVDKAKQVLEDNIVQMNQSMEQALCEAQEHAVAANRARESAEGDSERARAGVLDLEKLTRSEVAKADPTPAVLAVTLAEQPNKDLIPLALRALERGLYEEAEQALTILTRSSPDDATGWLLQARLRIEQNRPGEALVAAVRARASATDPNLTATAIGWQGYASWALGDRAGAAKAYEQYRADMVALVQAEPDIPDHRKGLAVAWIRLGEFSDDRRKAAAAFTSAERVLRKLTRRHRGVAEYHRELAGALRRRAGVTEATDGRRDLLTQAEAELTRAGARTPNSRAINRDAVWLMAAWGDCHHHGGDRAQAKKCWSKAVSEWQAMEDVGMLDWHGQRALADTRAKLGALGAGPDAAPEE